MVISTCNRTELMGIVHDPKILIDYLCSFSGGRNAHASNGHERLTSSPDGNMRTRPYEDNMHSGRTDNIACGEHQQHACQQRTHPLTLPRLAPQPPLSLWQSRACAGSDIGTGQTSKCAPQSRPDGQGRMRRRGWAHLVGGGRPDTPRCHCPSSCCARCQHLRHECTNCQSSCGQGHAAS